MLALMLAERAAFLATIRSLSDEDFASGRTLCARWAPRDVLAHMIGVDRELHTLWRTGLVAGRFNAAVVARSRVLPRAELDRRGAQWAGSPSVLARSFAWFLIGDVSVHHRDVVRGLGLQRAVPARIGAAILREGMVLGPHRLVRHRIVPTDGHRSVGVPGRPEVRGTAEALGLWLAGRSAVAGELTFVR